LQLAADYLSIDIGHKETKHDGLRLHGENQVQKKKNSINSGKASKN